MSNINIKKEILNELRSADLISISDRGVTTTTEEFNGDSSTTDFTLTGTDSGDGGIKNIRSVTVGGVSQTFGTDWTLSDDFSVVSFTTAPVTGTNNVDIQYDFSGVGDRIYPDFPKTTISNDKYPRIGFDIISESQTPKALQGAIYQIDILFTFVAYGNGASTTETLADDIKSFLLSKQRSWFYLNFLKPQGKGPILPIDQTNNKIFQRSLDFNAPFEFEIP